MEDDIKKILTEFINLGAQVKYNIVKSEHQFEKKQLETLGNKLTYLGEEIPLIIFREKDYYFEGSILADVNYSLTNKQLCDKIFDFSMFLMKWAEDNNVSQIIPLIERMAELSNQTLLKINLEYLN